MREIDGGKSSSFLQFVEIISSAEEMLARGKEISCSWHRERNPVIAESVGALPPSLDPCNFRELPLTSKILVFVPLCLKTFFSPKPPL